MSRLLLALCICSAIACAFAGPFGRRGPGSGRSGGHGRGGHGGKRGAPVCEMTSAKFNKTRPCTSGDCTLGLTSVDADGNEVSVKFCDGVDEAGTSLVVRSACLVRDEEDNVLVNRTVRRGRRGAEVAIDCSIELPTSILYENQTAFATFPNVTKQFGKDCRKDIDDEEEEEESSEEGSSEEDTEGPEGEGEGEEGGAEEGVDAEPLNRQQQRQQQNRDSNRGSRRRGGNGPSRSRAGRRD